MTSYRIYKLSSADRIFAGEWIEAPDDQAALRRAREICETGVPMVEVWQGARCLGRIACANDNSD